MAKKKPVLNPKFDLKDVFYAVIRDTEKRPFRMDKLCVSAIMYTDGGISYACDRKNEIGEMYKASFAEVDCLTLDEAIAVFDAEETKGV